MISGIEIEGQKGVSCQNSPCKSAMVDGIDIDGAVLLVNDCGSSLSDAQGLNNVGTQTNPKLDKKAATVEAISQFSSISCVFGLSSVLRRRRYGIKISIVLTYTSNLYLVFLFIFDPTISLIRQRSSI